MPKALVVYYSRTGNTEAMARLISKAIEGEGLSVVCKKVEDTDPDDLLDADGIKDLLASGKKISAKAWGFFYYYAKMGKIE